MFHTHTHTSGTERVLHRVNITTPIRLSISQSDSSSPAPRERWLQQWSCLVDWMRCLSGDWRVTLLLLCGSAHTHMSKHLLTKHALTYTHMYDFISNDLHYNLVCTNDAICTVWLTTVMDSYVSPQALITLALVSTRLPSVISCSRDEAVCPPSFFPTIRSAFPPYFNPSLLPVLSIIHKLKASA